uniref:Mediator of RNA polymerase II transcription subunit 31 n=1 Tax=Timema monikensis TaxID=170555 RepID=A0A7R9HM40_9NEOP|nr:unnamed protein product [Timema monikensis]
MSAKHDKLCSRPNINDEVAGDSHLLIFPGMMRLAGEHCSIIRREDPEMYMHTGCHGRGDRGSNLAQVLVRMTAKNCFETDDQQLRFQAEQEFVQCLGDPNYLNFLAQRGYFKEKDQQRLRFQIELEFVQCLERSCVVIETSAVCPLQPGEHRHKCQLRNADIGGSEIPCNLMVLLHTMPTRQHYRDDYSFVGDMLAAPSINTPISVRRAGSHVVCSPPSTKLPMPLKHR